MKDNMFSKAYYAQGQEHEYVWCSNKGYSFPTQRMWEWEAYIWRHLNTGNYDMWWNDKDYKIYHTNKPTGRFPNQPPEHYGVDMRKSIRKQIARLEELLDNE